MTASHPATLEYAEVEPGVAPALRPVARGLFVLSVFSGLCVGVCFVPLILSNSFIAAAVHATVFAVTIAIGLRVGYSLQQLTKLPLLNVRNILDVVALLGLCVFAVVPLLCGGWERESRFAPPMTFAFFALATTNWRHVVLYRLLAAQCRVGGLRHTARWLTLLGWLKMIYEGLWLTCCFALTALLALNPEITPLSSQQLDAARTAVGVGALFGCLGYGGIWIFMIVLHTVLWRLSTRTNSPPTLMVAEVAQG